MFAGDGAEAEEDEEEEGEDAVVGGGVGDVADAATRGTT